MIDAFTDSSSRESFFHGSSCDLAVRKGFFQGFCIFCYWFLMFSTRRSMSLWRKASSKWIKCQMWYLCRLLPLPPYQPSLPEFSDIVWCSWRCRRCGTGGYLLTSTWSPGCTSCVIVSNARTNQHSSLPVTPPTSNSPLCLCVCLNYLNLNMTL